MSALRPDHVDQSSAGQARAAVIARLEQLCQKPARPPKSLQPTPEANKSKITRLRRKRRLLELRSKQRHP
jgi:hypothetical protein